MVKNLCFRPNTLCMDTHPRADSRCLAHISTSHSQPGGLDDSTWADPRWHLACCYHPTFGVESRVLALPSPPCTDTLSIVTKPNPRIAENRGLEKQTFLSSRRHISVLLYPSEETSRTSLSTGNERFLCFSLMFASSQAFLLENKISHLNAAGIYLEEMVRALLGNFIFCC